MLIKLPNIVFLTTEQSLTSDNRTVSCSFLSYMFSSFMRSLAHPVSFLSRPHLVFTNFDGCSLHRLFLKRPVWFLLPRVYPAHNTASRYLHLTFGRRSNPISALLGLSGFMWGHSGGMPIDGCVASLGCWESGSVFNFMRVRENKYTCDAQGQLRAKAGGFSFLPPGVLFGCAPIFPSSH